MWNGLSDAKKALFQKQAADLKEKHYKDYPDWKWSNKDRKRYVNLRIFPESWRPYLDNVFLEMERWIKNCLKRVIFQKMNIQQIRMSQWNRMIVQYHYNTWPLRWQIVPNQFQIIPKVITTRFTKCTKFTLLTKCVRIVPVKLKYVGRTFWLH